MDKLFLQIINMSITATYVGLFVIIFRLFLKKAPKIFSYALWSVVFLRLILPFSFESMLSLIPNNVAEVSQSIIYEQIIEVDNDKAVIDNINNKDKNNAINQNIDKDANEIADKSVLSTKSQYSINHMQKWIVLGTSIWIFGLLALFIYIIISSFRLSKRLKLAKLIYDNIYEIDTIKTPFVFGILNAKIYLPSNLNETEKPYIIQHEQTHIRRFDNIIKFIAFLILSIHWFNPFTWLAFFLMTKDMELSCDESVIKKMGNEVKKSYSNSLLSLSIGKKIIGISPLAFGENNIKERIENILNYKKPRFWIIVTGLALVIVAVLGLLSNPKEKKEIKLDNYEKYNFTISELNTDTGKIELKVNSLDDSKGMYDGIVVSYNNIKKLYEWQNATNPAYYPIIYYEDMNGDNIKDIIINNTSSEYGLGTFINEIHVLNSNNLSEYKIENLKDYINANIKTKIDDKLSIDIKGKVEQINLEDYINMEDYKNGSSLYEKAFYGNVVQYDIEDGKIIARAATQISDVEFLGDLVFEYEFKNSGFIISNVRYTLENYIKKTESVKLINKSDALIYLGGEETSIVISEYDNYQRVVGINERNISLPTKYVGYLFEKIVVEDIDNDNDQELILYFNSFGSGDVRGILIFKVKDNDIIQLPFPLYDENTDSVGLKEVELSFTDYYEIVVNTTYFPSNTLKLVLDEELKTELMANSVVFNNDLSKGIDSASKIEIEKNTEGKNIIKIYQKIWGGVHSQRICDLITIVEMDLDNKINDIVDIYLSK